MGRVNGMTGRLKARGQGYRGFIELEIDLGKFESWKDVEFEIRHLGLRPDRAEFEVVFQGASEDETREILEKTIYEKKPR